MNKKILLLTVVVLICFLSSCFSGLQDWDKDIINGYSLIRVNDGVIVISLVNGSNATRAVDEYVDQYCYNDTYIGAKRIPIPEGVHMTYEEICQLETITYEYYLINTMTAQVHGPLTEEEYADLCEEIDVEMCDWITTHSLEKYVAKTESATTVDVTTQIQHQETSPDSEEQEYFVSETRAIFDFKIKDNPIDSEYNRAEVPSTTKDLCEHELYYAGIWMAELNASCEEFAKLLSDEDREAFEANQAAWESVVKEDRELLGDIFGEGKYSVHMGSVFQIEVASNYRKAVRERTLYVKYLQYSFESNSEGVSGEVEVGFAYKNS